MNDTRGHTLTKQHSMYGGKVHDRLLYRQDNDRALGFKKLIILHILLYYTLLHILISCLTWEGGEV